MPESQLPSGSAEQPSVPAPDAAADAESGQPAPSETIVYDFRRPERLNTEQLRTLRLLGDRFSRRLGVVLSAYLRSVLTVSSSSLEPSSYGEFIRSLPETTSVWVFGFEPVVGTGVLELNLDASYAVVYSMLGGIGEITVEERALTEIEQGIVEKVTKIILSTLEEEWQEFRALQFAVTGRESNPAMLNLAAGSEPFAVARYDFSIGESPGQLTLAIPALALDDMGLTSEPDWQRRVTRQARHQGEAYLRLLSTVPFSVAAAVESQIASSDVLALRVGDTLSLGTPATSDVQLSVAGTPKFTGRLFVEDGRLRLRLSSIAGSMGASRPPRSVAAAGPGRPDEAASPSTSP